MDMAVHSVFMLCLALGPAILAIMMKLSLFTLPNYEGDTKERDFLIICLLSFSVLVFFFTLLANVLSLSKCMATAQIQRVQKAMMLSL